MTEVQEDLGHAGPTLEADKSEGAWLEVDEEASLLLVSHGSRVAGRIVALSMAGCRISVWEKFKAGIQLRVEASFRVNGIAFRFIGVTDWTDGHRLVGIRFVDVTSRRMDELIEVLAELAEDARKLAEKKAAEKKAADAAIQSAAAAIPGAGKAAPDKPPAESSGSQSPSRPAPLLPARTLAALSPMAARLNPAGKVLSSPLPALQLLEPRLPARRPSFLAPVPLGPAADAPVLKPPQSKAASQPPAKPTGRDRRSQSRHDVDTSAIIFLVNVASRIGGRILNLSMGGCRIRTHERFPVGIYTRVETEFQLEGLSFRLGGVVQAIQDLQHVGIRFLDMSERKRELLEQLIEEIEELDDGG